MSVPLAKQGDASINALKLTDEIRYQKYAFERIDHQPNLFKADGFSDPTGTAADINSFVFRRGLAGKYIVKGTQTLLGPLLDTTGKGLDISQDQTDNDGVEYVFGSNDSNSPFAFTVGTHNAFVKLKFRIADVSGTDDCALGFRKVEAAQANLDDYDEAAFINVILGAIKVETILNNAATVTTDTGLTWADDATKTLEVRLIGRRVYFLVEGSPVSGLPAFSFDSGEVVNPFFFFLQATTSPGKVWWLEAEMGLLKTVQTKGLPS
jgi:hypothetical protein